MNVLFNAEIEEAVIGCVLIDSAVSINACNEAGVAEHWFCNPILSKMYEAMIDMARHGEPIDITSLSNFSHKKKLHLDIKKAEDILARSFTATSVGHYVSELRNYWLLRQIDFISKEACHKVTTETPQSVLDELIVKACSLNAMHDVTRPSDHHDEHKRRRALAKGQGYVGYPSRFSDINEFIGSYNQPDNIVLAARPSTGKTAFMLNEAIDKAENYGCAVAIASLDMDEYALRMRMAGEKAEVNTFQFRTKNWTDEDAYKIDCAYETVNALPIYINDKRMNIDRLVSWVINMKARHNIGLLMVDFVQHINRTRDEYHMPTTEVVGGWSGTIKALGKKLHMATMLLSQLNRGENRNKEITPPHPSLEALRSSGDIEQNADIVMMMCKKPNEPEWKFSNEHSLWDIDIDIAKNRNGPLGLVPMTLWTTKQRFIPFNTAQYMRQENGIT